MSIKIGINGMGRIGRMVVRAIFESNYKNIQIKHINNRTNSEACSALLKYDSIHGKFNAQIDFDEKHLDVFSQWHEILLISNIKNISKSDSREVNYILSALKSDILKINDKNIPHVLNHPQIIGRFRVLKTDILKINIDDLSPQKISRFKDHLKDIIVSHNAFVNTMNLVVNKNNNDEVINLGI